MNDVLKEKNNILINYGDDTSKHLGAISVPIYQTSVFSRKHGSKGYNYTRVNNPTIELAEKKLAKLGNGEDALLFSSGMGAITAAIMSCINYNDHVLCVRDVYLTTRRFLEDYLKEKCNVTTDYFVADDFEEFLSKIKSHTKIIFLETAVSNIFKIPDIEAICKIAKEKNIKVIVDSTYATPLFCNPLDYGADIVAHSCSKYIGGHGDLIGGVLISDKETVSSIRSCERSAFGACMDPHQAWLLLRGMRTLVLRMKEHMKNGFIVAEFLENSPYIEEVIHPGLKSSSQYERANKYFSGFPGLFCFVPKGGLEKSILLEKYLEVPEKGPSWGGYETLMNHPGCYNDQNYCLEVTDVKCGQIRLSVGLEDPELLINDFKQAFNKTYKE